MTVYSINPKSKVDSNNILNVMSQLVLHISTSISSIYNLSIPNNYNFVLNIINNVLNEYLKNYNFFKYGIKNIVVQIYNQNIELVIQTGITIAEYNYVNYNSRWNDFYKGNYNQKPKVVYNELTPQQQNDLRISIISGNLFYLDNIVITTSNYNSIGIILKPKLTTSITTYSNKCMCVNESNNIYITTIYWY